MRKASERQKQRYRLEREQYLEEQMNRFEPALVTLLRAIPQGQRGLRTRTMNAMLGNDIKSVKQLKAFMATGQSSYGFGVGVSKAIGEALTKLVG